MTVSELEQAMRNLISTQPMITVGPNGEVVSSLLAIIDVYKNFSFKVQTYPAQDAFKFGMIGEIQKLENDLSNYICQTMSSRGINLLLYSPQSQYGSVGNSYGTVPGSIPQNMMMGQMMYQQPMNVQFAQAAPQQPMNVPNIAQFKQMPNMMAPAGQPSQFESRMNQQPIGGGVIPQKPPMRRPVMQGSPERNMGQSVVKTNMQPSSQQRNASLSNGVTFNQPATANQASQPQEEKPQNASPSKSNPAEMLMGGGDAPSGKAPGRDYLLELLKK